MYEFIMIANFNPQWHAIKGMKCECMCSAIAAGRTCAMHIHCVSALLIRIIHTTAYRGNIELYRFSFTHVVIYTFGFGNDQWFASNVPTPHHRLFTRIRIMYVVQNACTEYVHFLNGVSMERHSIQPYRL